MNLYVLMSVVIVILGLVARRKPEGQRWLDRMPKLPPVSNTWIQQHKAEAGKVGCLPVIFVLLVAPASAQSIMISCRENTCVVQNAPAQRLTPDGAIRFMGSSPAPAFYPSSLTLPPHVVIVTKPAPPRSRVYPSLAAVPWAERAAVPWRHVAPAAEDPTIRNVRIVP